MFVVVQTDVVCEERLHCMVKTKCTTQDRTNTSVCVGKAISDASFAPENNGMSQE